MAFECIVMGNDTKDTFSAGRVIALKNLSYRHGPKSELLVPQMRRVELKFYGTDMAFCK